MAAEERDAAEGGFLFVGEALALDLVNTEVVVRGKPADLLDPPGALAAWWRAARARYPDAIRGGAGPIPSLDDPVLPAAKALRAALRRIFGAVADVGNGRAVPVADLAVLNRVLATGYEALAIDPSGALHSIVGHREAGPDGALLPIARSAFDLLTTKEPARLHHCRNDRCVLLFYDTTKSATRRWCSVGCMNRARSVQRYRARKQTSTATGATQASAPRPAQTVAVAVRDGILPSSGGGSPLPRPGPSRRHRRLGHGSS